MKGQRQQCSWMEAASGFTTHEGLCAVHTGMHTRAHTCLFLRSRGGLNPVQHTLFAPGTQIDNTPIFPCLTSARSPELRSLYFHIAEEKTETEKGYVACPRSVAGEQPGLHSNLEEVRWHLGSSFSPLTLAVPCREPQRWTVAVSSALGPGQGGVGWGLVLDGPQHRPCTLVSAQTLENSECIRCGPGGGPRKPHCSPPCLCSALHRLWGLCKPQFAHP